MKFPFYESSNRTTSLSAAAIQMLIITRRKKCTLQYMADDQIVWYKNLCVSFGIITCCLSRSYTAMGKSQQHVIYAIHIQHLAVFITQWNATHCTLMLFLSPLPSAWLLFYPWSGRILHILFPWPLGGSWRHVFDTLLYRSWTWNGFTLSLSWLWLMASRQYNLGYCT